MSSDMEFEKQLNELGENQLELIKFVARQQYSLCKVVGIHDKRISEIEKQNKKFLGLIGGIGAVIGAALASVADFLIRRS